MHVEKYENSEQRAQRLNAVVALGKNWRLPIEGKRIYLSIESKMTALAAAQLYVDQQTEKIILSGGKTAGNDPDGKPYPAEADEMRNFLRIFFSEEEVPEAALELERNSFDTAGNAEEVGKIIAREELQRVALLTVGTHLARSSKLFADYKVPIIKSFSSEEILRGRNHHFDKLLHDYFWSTKHFKEAGREILGVGLVYTIDPKGKLLRKITKKTRNRGS